MSDWAALDVTAAVAWMRDRYTSLPLNYVGHSFGGQALGLLPNNTEVSRALLIAAQAGYWKLMASPERYRVYAMMNFVGMPLTRLIGYAPGWIGLGEDLPKGVFLQWVKWVMSKRYMFDDTRRSRRLSNFPQLPGRVACAVHLRRSLGDAAGGRTAVFGIYIDQAGNRYHHAGGCGRERDRSLWIFSQRTSRDTMEECGGMDSSDGARVTALHFRYLLPACTHVR